MDWPRRKRYEYHCDFVILSRDLATHISAVSVGSMGEWVESGLPDHCPVIVDIWVQPSSTPPFTSPRCALPVPVGSTIPARMNTQRHLTNSATASGSSFAAGCGPAESCGEELESGRRWVGAGHGVSVRGGCDEFGVAEIATICLALGGAAG